MSRNNDPGAFTAPKKPINISLAMGKTEDMQMGCDKALITALIEKLASNIDVATDLARH